MKSREELRNDYEEALFAMIMDDIMELEGEALLAERERLRASDEHRVPDDISERCRGLIAETLAETENRGKKRGPWKLCRTALLAALIASLCFSTVYASVPQVRAATDRLMIQISNISATLSFAEDGAFESDEYELGYIPEGFVLTEEVRTAVQCCYAYASDASTISIQIAYDASNWESSVDVEQAETVERFADGSYEGLLVEKGDRVHLAVADSAHNSAIQIITEGLGRDETMRILNGLRH